MLSNGAQTFNPTFTGNWEHMNATGDVGMNETAIKSAILNHWREGGRVSKRTVIANEYVLGSNGRRADLALLGEDFVGVEIKSNLDSLSRLKPQVEAYESCFDRVVVIAGSRHLKQCKLKLPYHIEIWEIDENEVPILRRPASGRPVAKLNAMARLLTMQQLRKIACAKAGDMPKSALLKYASLLPEITLRAAVHSAFQEAYAGSSNNFWKTVSRRKIRPEDISTLSRYYPARSNIVEAREQEERYWQEWLTAASDVFFRSGTAQEA